MSSATPGDVGRPPTVRGGAMRISVTQADIDAGRRSAIREPAFARCVLCPVARAITRATGLPAFVSPSEAVIASVPTSTAIPLPREASEFIARYDDGEPVSPLEFDLPIYLRISSTADSSGGVERGRAGGDPPGPPPAPHHGGGEQ